MLALVLSHADYEFSVRVARLLPLDPKAVAEYEHAHNKREIELKKFTDGQSAEGLAVADDLFRKQFVKIAFLAMSVADDLSDEIANTFSPDAGFGLHPRDREALVRFFVRFIYDGDEANRRTIAEESARKGIEKLADSGVSATRPLAFLACALLCSARNLLSAKLTKEMDFEVAKNRMVRRLFDADNVPQNAEHIWRAAKAPGEFGPNYDILSKDPIERKPRSL